MFEKKQIKTNISDPIVVAADPSGIDRAGKGWGIWQFPQIKMQEDGLLHVYFSLAPDSYYSIGKKGAHYVSLDRGKTWTSEGEIYEHDFTDGVLLPNGDRIKTDARLSSTRIKSNDMPEAVTSFNCSYGYPRALFPALELPPEFSELRLMRLKRGENLWREEASKLNIPNHLITAVDETTPSDTGRSLDPVEINDRFLLLPPNLYGKIRVAPDGSVWASTYGFRLFDNIPFYAPVFLRSVDYGKTWDMISEIRYHGDLNVDRFADKRDGFTEPDFCFMPDGSIITIMRTMDGNGHGPVYFTRSTDNGATWSPPAAFDSYGKVPQLLRLNGEITLLSYGASGGPGYFSLRSTADPSGMDWSDAQHFFVSDAPSGTYDTCGHTEMEKSEDNEVVLVYSDFNFPGPDGTRRKTILVRRITIEY